MTNGFRDARPAPPREETPEERAARVDAMAGKIRERFLVEARRVAPVVDDLVDRIGRADRRCDAADLGFRLGELLELFEEAPEGWIDRAAASTYVGALGHIRSVGGWPGRRMRAHRLAARFGLAPPCSRSGAVSATQGVVGDVGDGSASERRSGAPTASGGLALQEAGAVGER